MGGRREEWGGREHVRIASTYTCAHATTYTHRDRAHVLVRNPKSHFLRQHESTSLHPEVNNHHAEVRSTHAHHHTRAHAHTCTRARRNTDIDTQRDRHTCNTLLPHLEMHVTYAHRHMYTHQSPILYKYKMFSHTTTLTCTRAFQYTNINDTGVFGFKTVCEYAQSNT